MSYISNGHAVIFESWTQEMSSSSEDERIQVCELCGEDKGLCDQPGLRDDRFFTIKLDETFDVSTVRNDDKCFFVIKHDFYFFKM